MMTELSVRQARDNFLTINSFTLEGYATPRFPVKLGRLTLVFPNPRLLHLHDLHHVATGYDTSLIGEAEISCFELRAGCRTALIHLLCFGAIFFALFLAPRRLVRAWRSAKGARTLYYTDQSYDELLTLSLKELRSSMGIPATGYNEKRIYERV